jgi:DNA-binding NtrC family response regulator
MGRILVIDDEEDVRFSLQRRLKREGHDVEIAGSQAEGIESIQQAQLPFDLVLSDMLMESPNSGV